MLQLNLSFFPNKRIHLRCLSLWNNRYRIKFHRVCWMRFRLLGFGLCNISTLDSCWKWLLGDFWFTNCVVWWQNWRWWHVWCVLLFLSFISCSVSRLRILWDEFLIWNLSFFLWCFRYRLRSCFNFFFHNSRCSLRSLNFSFFFIFSSYRLGSWSFSFILLRFFFNKGRSKGICLGFNYFFLFCVLWFCCCADCFGLSFNFNFIFISWFYGVFIAAMGGWRLGLDGRIRIRIWITISFLISSIFRLQFSLLILLIFFP